MDDFAQALESALNRPVRQDAVLRNYSSFCIGGPARYFVEAFEMAELKAAISLCRSRNMPFYLIGSGTNLLFDDSGYRGLILKNGCRGISLRSDRDIQALSGTRLAEIVEFAAARGLRGMEFLAGIPGTVGGAVFGNAGAFGRAIGEILTEALLLDGQGREAGVPAEYFRFGYRRSRLRTEHQALLSVTLRLVPGEEAAIRALMAEHLGQRLKKHPPPGTACAGCYFKNPVLPDGSKVSAGRILEEAGAKSLKSGDAAVSPRHSNFIVNEGRARSEDVRKLAAELKSRIRERYGYELEEEVIYLPADASMP
jgi:UDP-N-acetylmuramate dehydrogenase